MARRHKSTAEVEMGVEVSTCSATEATRDSIADMKLEVAVPLVSDTKRVLGEHAGEGLPS
jgi:hypothetical protein